MSARHDEGIRGWRVGATAALAGLIVLSSAGLWVVQRDLQPLIDLAYPGTAWIGPAELADRLATDGGPVLLDARQPEEYAVSHLRGAVRVDPDAPDVAALGLRPGDPVVVYCAVGWRSASVAAALRRAGVSNVRNLRGGIFTWAERGEAVVRGGVEVREVHPFDAWWGLLLDRRLHATDPRSRHDGSDV
ncbi:MAG: rhodanese-like domain-containing protein [Sandaracinaceae bacterium]